MASIPKDLSLVGESEKQTTATIVVVAICS